MLSWRMDINPISSHARTSKNLKVREGGPAPFLGIFILCPPLTFHHHRVLASSSHSIRSSCHGNVWFDSDFISLHLHLITPSQWSFWGRCNFSFFFQQKIWLPMNWPNNLKCVKTFVLNDRSIEWPHQHRIQGDAIDFCLINNETGYRGHKGENNRQTVWRVIIRLN